MNVKVCLHLILHRYADGQEVAMVNGNTVSQCLNDLARQFPAIEKALFDGDGKLLGYLCIYLNKEIVYTDKLETPVGDGDELYILPLFVGG